MVRETSSPALNQLQISVSFDPNETIDNILDNLANFNAIIKPDNGYGMRYEVHMALTGANGKTANVITAWMVDDNTGVTRLTSAYVTKKRIKGG